MTSMMHTAVAAAAAPHYRHRHHEVVVVVGHLQQHPVSGNGLWRRNSNLICRRRRRRVGFLYSNGRSIVVRGAAAAEPMTAPEQQGGKMVVELVGAFKQVTGRMELLSTSSSRLLFKALKLSIPILHTLPLSPDGRSPLSKALSLALLLADLQMDAEVISAGILREALEAAAISIKDVRDRIGAATAHLLYESWRIKRIPAKVQVLDDDTAAALRKFCLTFYDVRALILDLGVKLDMMRHLDYMPRYHQQMFSLQVMKIHAPLAHAVGANSLSLELEDLSFKYLFPHSYLDTDKWLRSHETGIKPLIRSYRDELLHSLKADPLLSELVAGISVEGRYKTRYSTMKKLIRDGRKPEEVNDILGLRIILTPRPEGDGSELGESACYQVHKIIQSMWKEIPQRTKDYIAMPKANGYRSLHMAVDVSDGGMSRPLMEIQIRTKEMDMLAVGGTASHSLYKAGLTNPEEAKRLKAIMIAAAELAALRLKDIPLSNHRPVDVDRNDQVFRLIDTNEDGKISIDELMDVMEELGAQGEDAREMMQLLDSNSDGSLSTDEFNLFQKQVEIMLNLEGRDEEYRKMLNQKIQMTDNSGLIQAYRKELGERLAVS